MIIRQSLTSAIALAALLATAAPALAQPKAGLGSGMTLSPSERATQEAWWAKHSNRQTDTAKPQAHEKMGGMMGEHPLADMSGCCPEMPKSSE